MSQSRKLRRIAVYLIVATFPALVIADDSARSYHYVGGPAPSTAEKSGTDESVRIFQPHDGTFETGFTYAENEEVQFVQQFVFPSENGRLLAFEACFATYGGDVPGFIFEFQYYAGGVEGEDAEPGTFRESQESLPFTVAGGGAVTCHVIEFYVEDVDPGIDIRELATYLGVEWDADDYPTVLVAVDTNGENQGPGWGRVNDLISPEWSLLSADPTFSDFQNLGIRVAWAGFDPAFIFEDGFESGDTTGWSSTIEE